MKWRRVLTPLMVGLAYACYGLWKQQGGGGPGPLPYNVIGSVRTVAAQDLTWERLPTSPRLVTGTCVNSWPALQKWENLTYIAELLPRVDHVMASRAPSFAYWDDSQPWGTLENFRRSYLLANQVQVQCILEKKGCDDSDSWLHDTTTPPEVFKYYQSMAVSKLPAAMQAEIKPLDCLADSSTMRRSRIWFSSPGTASALHYDTDNNLLAQVVGRKVVTLMPPSQHLRLHLRSAPHASWRQSQVDDIHKVLRGRFPLYNNATAFQVTLTPGDVLFIPPYWFHHVQAVTAAVSVNVWTEAATYSATEAIRSTTLPFNPAEDAPDKLAVLSRSFLRSIVDAVFKADGGGVAALEMLLQSRHVEAHLGDHPPASLWLQFLGTGVADEVRSQLESDTPLRTQVAAAAKSVVRLLAKLPKSVRHIETLDYVEEVGNAVVTALVERAFETRAELRKTEPNLAEDLTPFTVEVPGAQYELQLFVYIRDCLLSEAATAEPKPATPQPAAAATAEAEPAADATAAAA